MRQTPSWTNRAWWARAARGKTRRDRRGAWWRFAVASAAGGLGAGLMYVLDPQTGRRRRHLAYDRGAAAVRHTRRRLGRWGHRLGADVRGTFQRVRRLRTGRSGAADDQTLGDRVRSEILRGPAVPSGRINVNVEDGVVVLRGQLDRLELIRSLTESARRVPGVRDVVSYLHLPETPAPNKQAAVAAGRDAVLPPAVATGSDDATPPPS